MNKIHRGSSAICALQTLGFVATGIVMFTPVGGAAVGTALGIQFLCLVLNGWLSDLTNLDRTTPEGSDDHRRNSRNSRNSRNIARCSVLSVFQQFFSRNPSGTPDDKQQAGGRFRAPESEVRQRACSEPTL